MLDDFPLSRVVISMPGAGVKTGARILLEIGDGSAFTSADTWPPTPESHR
jgi:hypothetical protein